MSIFNVSFTPLGLWKLLQEQAQNMKNNLKEMQQQELMHFCGTLHRTQLTKRKVQKL